MQLAVPSAADDGRLTCWPCFSLHAGEVGRSLNGVHECRTEPPLCDGVRLEVDTTTESPRESAEDSVVQAVFQSLKSIAVQAARVRLEFLHASALDLPQ